MLSVAFLIVIVAIILGAVQYIDTANTSLTAPETPKTEKGVPRRQ